ncbi:aspartate aminotransferase family protein [Candidatus Venteria ishoeyi]|uniref:Acetylornithine aminotransferase n=1 Tax=Candidatus Venteria ishoeyi TaxID=1899563 RepID=A0A1H6FAU0_9GAMM|nr:aspartate aminotransferase family protein [Candidatus Venteria ishoeyi]MDM8545338.1 aspartate aminotransferase family protein [Candidatus Venteria ishoeyi]SEH07222.1 Acetylornithine aminotransferase [Candidatus Venteria ishoeyi]
MKNTLMPNYSRLPISFIHGKGAQLWDDTEQVYLDALSGISVCNLGHAHPAIRDAICEQAETLLHTSNIYGIDKQQKLADKLVALSGMETVFFANSGAEANEAAIKIARLTGHQRGLSLPKIIVMEGSFHGRTLATLSATGNRKVQAGFEPLVQGFIRVAYNDIEAVERVAKQETDVVAILVEPIQGEGGIQIPDADYLPRLRALCDQHNWLLMLDEIQTGIARSGRWFEHQHHNIKPDVMTLAKALGNGVPIGACLAVGEAASRLQPGTHGSTFGGNPLACRVGLTVLDIIEQENLCQRAAELGARFQQGFEQALQDLPGVSEIRIKGLLIGIELDKPCPELVMQALEQGLLINVTAGQVIRLLPPLIISDAQADEMIKTVSALIHDFLS